MLGALAATTLLCLCLVPPPFSTALQIFPVPVHQHISDLFTSHCDERFDIEQLEIENETKHKKSSLRSRVSNRLVLVPTLVVVSSTFSSVSALSCGREKKMLMFLCDNFLRFHGKTEVRGWFHQPSRPLTINVCRFIQPECTLLSVKATTAMLKALNHRSHLQIIM
jgi:hypothetical protein